MFNGQKTARASTKEKLFGHDLDRQQNDGTVDINHDSVS